MLDYCLVYLDYAMKFYGDTAVRPIGVGLLVANLTCALVHGIRHCG